MITGFIICVRFACLFLFLFHCGEKKFITQHEYVYINVNTFYVQ